MKEVKIEVTQNHIEAGARRSCDRCPIALALLDAGFPSPYVSSKWARLNHDYGQPEQQGKRQQVSLPEIAQQFVRFFDSPHHSVEPFSFTIKVLERV